jgi:hypothetical protein
LTDGCGADITAQILTQALLGSKPHVDLVEFARTEAKERWSKRPAESLEKWKQGRDPPEQESAKTDYEGDYIGFGGVVKISVRFDKGEDRLTVVYGDVPATKMPLELYATDTYSAWPADRDVRIQNSVNYWEHVVGLLKFQRGEDGKINSIFWEYCSEEVPTILEKV